MSTIDGSIQNSARAAIQGSVTFLASFGVIMVLIPAFAPLALAIAMIYIIMAPNYIRASRDLRRLESLALSPTFAGFDELLRGLAHIRAYAMETRYQKAFYKKVDTFQNFDHIYVSARAGCR
jgi:ABC-type multidrug transport system fused ATPase/permease subunit